MQVTPAFNFRPPQLAGCERLLDLPALWNSPPEGGHGTGKQASPRGPEEAGVLGSQREGMTELGAALRSPLPSLCSLAPSAPLKLLRAGSAGM